MLASVQPWLLGLKAQPTENNAPVVVCEAAAPTISHWDTSTLGSVNGISSVRSGLSSTSGSTSNTAFKRKGQPQRSPSWADATPGVILRLDPQPIVIGDTSAAVGWRERSWHSSPWLQCPSYAGFKRAENDNNLADNAVMVKRGRSRSTPHIFTAANGNPDHENDPVAQRRMQQRKGSLDMGGGENHLMLETVAESSPDGRISYPSHHNPALSHLVPNRRLSTTSRRISTHAPSTGCICASCQCAMTPYWRDGWSPEVMLCNACGLRFQKFARRCSQCLYIPRKEDSVDQWCNKCGAPWIDG